MNRVLLATMFVAFLLGASGCGDIRHGKLVGAWAQDKDNSIFTLNADGTMSGVLKTGSWGIVTPTVINISGNWRLSGDDIIFEITSSNYRNDELRGFRASEKIVNIFKNSFTTIGSDGDRCEYSRVR